MTLFYVAGASSRSRTARVYLEYLNRDFQISAFLVSPEMTDNDSFVDGVPVLPIDSSSDLIDITLPVYLGTRGANHPKLESELREIGFEKIIPVTMELDSELRNEYLEKVFAGEGRDFIRMDMLTSMNTGHDGTLTTGRIYVAKSVFDSVLKDLYTPLDEETGIQVGCDMSDEKLNECQFFDNDGDNISKLNGQFCELTGLYWIWKHAKEDYIGLVHYRRHFLLQKNWIDLCYDNGVDVILPVPLYVSPSIAENYRERHIASDWECLMNYFDEKFPDEQGAAVKFFSGNLYSPCNMIVAKREVLNDLCSWLFPIVFYVFKNGGERENAYQRRYPGFISERLITYFFESCREKYKIVYCNKNFLE